jgi:aspartyl-tRNA(Asn)/glutamyl-tRNA(Gln) amidotransferase subunit C
MTAISKEQVRHVASLARIDLDEDEIDRMASQLGSILGYFGQIDELDTEEVEPMKSVMGLHNVFREDDVRGSLVVEQALGNAPDRTRDCFRVPVVVE